MQKTQNKRDRDGDGSAASRLQMLIAQNSMAEYRRYRAIVEDAAGVGAIRINLCDGKVPPTLQKGK